MPMGDLARSDEYGFDPMTGVPIGAVVADPKVTDYGQADLRPFAMGAIAQQRDYQPTDARGTDLWGYQAGNAGMMTPQDVDRATNTALAFSGGGLSTKGIRAYHSSPHDFDRFDLSKIGTGEGAQAYGHGLYFAESPAVSGQGGQYWNQFLNKFKGPERDVAERLKAANFDRKAAAGDLGEEMAWLEYNAKHANSPEVAAKHTQMLEALQRLESGAPVGPRTYEVDINADPAHFLDFDAPLSQQSKAVQELFPQFSKPHDYRVEPSASGKTWSVLHPGGWVPNAAQSFYKSEGAAQAAAQSLNASRKVEDLVPRTLEQAAMFREAGIPGVKYLDEGSRNARPILKTDRAGNVISSEYAPQTRNYVIFDPSKIDIRKKYAFPLAAGAGGMGALAASDNYDGVR